MYFFFSRIIQMEESHLKNFQNCSGPQASQRHDNMGNKLNTLTCSRTPLPDLFKNIFEISQIKNKISWTIPFIQIRIFDDLNNVFRRLSLRQCRGETLAKYVQIVLIAVQSFLLSRFLNLYKISNPTNQIVQNSNYMQQISLNLAIKTSPE